ncbi:hypothetical protein COLO4_24995 [Corchorus olitorius]|uniref:Uncharacterized protein n=1 Tax=Corchorus olitorius TaxID=93759 RepID=A0A1R3I5D2_9ROSI|nr:hypothetical protein COLO4_24995 [Corchorus olitorius]
MAAPTITESERGRRSTMVWVALEMAFDIVKAPNPLS